LTLFFWREEKERYILDKLCYIVVMMGELYVDIHVM